MSEEVTTIKEKGNSCLRAEKYEEAVLHYSHAIKLDPKNHSLYSNRSLAFLKMQQYYLALEDAKETIRIKPEWAKGYFRKAEVILSEVEFQTFNFNDALLSYKIALTLQPNDPSLEQAVKRTKVLLKKEKASDDQIPWIGAAIGIFAGAFIVLTGQILFTYRPILGNPILMVLIIVAVAVLGYFLANSSRKYVKSQRIALLEPPPNLFQKKVEKKMETPVGNNKEVKTRNLKAQARQRFKRGKP